MVRRPVTGSTSATPPAGSSHDSSISAASRSMAGMRLVSALPTRWRPYRFRRRPCSTPLSSSWVLPSTPVGAPLGDGVPHQGIEVAVGDVLVAGDVVAVVQLVVEHRVVVAHDAVVGVRVALELGRVEQTRVDERGAVGPVAHVEGLAERHEREVAAGRASDLRAAELRATDLGAAELEGIDHHVHGNVRRRHAAHTPGGSVRRAYGA